MAKRGDRERRFRFQQEPGAGPDDPADDIHGPLSPGRQVGKDGKLLPAISPQVIRFGKGRDMPTETPRAMSSPERGSFRYEVELEDGRVFTFELDQEVPETAQGQAFLQELLRLELQAEVSDRQNFPEETFLGDVSKGIVGGVRDFAQGVMDTPAAILNTITEFASGEPPGGARQGFIPEVRAPELPDVPTNLRDERSGVEKAVRIGSTVATGVASSLLVPGVRNFTHRKVSEALARRALRKRPIPNMAQTAPQDLSKTGGPFTGMDTGRPPPKQVQRELKHNAQLADEAAAREARAVPPDLDAPDAPRPVVPDVERPSTGGVVDESRVPRMGAAADDAGIPASLEGFNPAPDILMHPPSASAIRVAQRVLDFNAADISKLTLTRAANARKRLLAQLADDRTLLDETGPVSELLLRLEARIAQFLE